MNLTLGLYVPGTSIIHRTRPGWKMIAVVLFIIAVTVLIDGLGPALGVLAFSGLGYVVARIPWRVALGQLLPALPFLMFIAIIQAFYGKWEQGLITTITVLASVVAATLLTLTTKVSDMMDALEAVLAPTRKIGVPVDTIVLTLSLTLRMIPLQLQTVLDVRDARKARGLGMSVLAFGVPVIVRTINRARNMADGLAARGVGD